MRLTGFPWSYRCLRTSSTQDAQHARIRGGCRRGVAVLMRLMMAADRNANIRRSETIARAVE
jgi:hypothetical protein